MNDDIVDMSYCISDYVCPYCKSRGIDILMEKMGNRYICPICRSSILHGNITPQNIIEKIINSFEDNDDLNNILSPHPNCSYLNDILIEIRDSIQCGHYLSALSTLGVYLELLVKEIYFAHNGKRKRCELNEAIENIKELITTEEYNKLKQLKNKLRNPIVHGNLSELLSEAYIKEEIPEGPIDSLSSLDKFITDGGATYFIKAGDVPSIAFCTTYKTFFKQMAINSFNEVYDIAYILSFKYLIGPYHTPDYLREDLKRYTPDEFDTMLGKDNKGYVVIKTEKHIATSPHGIEMLIKNNSTP